MSESKSFMLRYIAQAFECENAFEDNKELKRAVLQFSSGGLASFVEVCVVYPLDLIKTRLQLQGELKPEDRYKGVFDCIRKMYKYEGIFSFYKGILIPLMSEAPKKAWKFLLYEQFKRLILLKFEMKSPNVLTHCVSGFAAGTIEGIFVTPFEVLKLNLQANRAVVPPSILSVATKIIRKDGFGLRGMNKGLFTTALRNGVFNMVYFSVYYGEKDYFAEYENKWQEFGRKFSTGFLAGVFAVFFSSPLDMAKSRIQCPQPGFLKYKTTYATMKMIVKEEGFFTLFTGIYLKIIRIGLGGAMMMLGYDCIYKYLVKHFLD